MALRQDIKFIFKASCKTKRQFKLTTYSNHAKDISPNILKDRDIIQNMSMKGNCWD